MAYDVEEFLRDRHDAVPFIGRAPDVPLGPQVALENSKYMLLLSERYANAGDERDALEASNGCCGEEVELVPWNRGTTSVDNVLTAKRTTVHKTGRQYPPSEALIAEYVTARQFNGTMHCATECPSVLLIRFLADAALVVVGGNDVWTWDIAEKLELSHVPANLCVEN